MSEDAIAYNAKKVNIVKANAEVNVVRAYCGCGGEFLMEHAVTVGIETTYHYQCNCGNKYTSVDVYPRVELVVPRRDLLGKDVLQLPISSMPIYKAG